MTKLPPTFHSDFPEKSPSDTRYKVAQYMINNHTQEFTAKDISEELDIGAAAVKTHWDELEEWIDDYDDGHRRYATWDTERYNPAEYEMTEAVETVTEAILLVGKQARRSTSELFAFVAIVALGASLLLVAGGAIAAFSPWAGSDSPLVYFWIGSGFAAGVLLILCLLAFITAVFRLVRNHRSGGE